MGNRLAVIFRVLPHGQVLTVQGRDAWALGELIRCGQLGVTPINNPAPRWSAYVHNLRQFPGLVIETVHEPHGGLFAGTHARYVLRSNVEVISKKLALAA